MLNTNEWEQSLSSGSGRSYGLESRFEYELNKLDFYAAYTYSRSIRTMEFINNGQEYFSKYDRPHVMSLIAKYDLSSSNKLIASFSYSSGNPITVPTGRYVTLLNGEEIVVEEFGGINNYRMPATHHLDISFVRSRKLKKVNTKTILGIYNVYNRLNPFMAFVGLDSEANPELKLRSFQPIMPMLKFIVEL